MHLSMRSLTLILLALFIDLVSYNALAFVEFESLIEDCLTLQIPGTMLLVAQILGPIGRTSEVEF